MTPTLRRLNDRERYFGLTWPGWFASGAAGGLLYGAVELSPFGLKPTITIAALLVALIAMVVIAVSGQALSPGRHLTALITYRVGPKVWTLPEHPDGRGLVLADIPDHDHDAPDGPQPTRSLAELAEERLVDPSTNDFMHTAAGEADA